MNTKEATRGYLDALSRICERVQRWCRDCNAVHYATNLTPAVCPLCSSDRVEVRS